jgi:hypothetical protein
MRAGFHSDILLSGADIVNSAPRVRKSIEVTMNPAYTPQQRQGDGDVVLRHVCFWLSST